MIRIFSYLPFFILAIYQLFYIYKAFQKRKPLKLRKRKILPQLTIITPIYNEENNINLHLDSILRNKLSIIKEVIVVLDHCTDTSEKITSDYIKIFQKNGILLKVIKLKKNITGKVNGILEGARIMTTTNALLMDADIILMPDAIEKLLYFHVQNENSYSSCLEFPYQEKNNHNILSNIICSDRLYRQNILQLVRSKYDMSNFPGGIAIVKIKGYIKFLNSGFLEDLTATYSLFGNNEKLSIYPEPLAYEIERQSIKGVLFQRIRWTIGNIENIPIFIVALVKIKGRIKKFLLISFPLLWYIQHYLIVIGITLFIIKFPEISSFIYLIPIVFYFVQILLSRQLGKEYYNNFLIGILAHCLTYPFIITASLFGAIITIIKTRKLYFKSELSNNLYCRI